MQKETIELLVRVQIKYSEPNARKEAIKFAKQCVKACAVRGRVEAEAKSVKLIEIVKNK